MYYTKQLCCDVHSVTIMDVASLKVVLERVPIELVIEFVMYMNLKEVENFILAMYDVFNLRGRIWNILHTRQNPKYIFEDLVDDTNSLLELMADFKVVLGKSRAANFFVPGSCTYTSDWNFYIASSNGLSLFMVHFQKLGAQWNKLPNSSIMTSTTTYTSTINKSGHSQKLKLTNLNSNTTLSEIVEFSSSVTQCFISGYTAVHMYSTLALTRQAINWHLNDLYLDTLVGKELEKYEKRGYSFISWPKHVVTRGKWNYTKNDETGLMCWRVRHIYDNDSKVVNFAPYVASGRYEEAVKYSLALRNFCWYEYPMGTSTYKNIATTHMKCSSNEVSFTYV